MQFTTENCQLILDGKKTMTRRVAKPGEAARLVGGTLYDSTGMVKWAVGRSYAIQPGRGKKAVGRIVITDIRREKLRDISDNDCWREGVEDEWGHDERGNRVYHSHLVRFMELWNSLYGTDPIKGWAANPEVFVISFELCG